MQDDNCFWANQGSSCKAKISMHSDTALNWHLLLGSYDMMYMLGNRKSVCRPRFQAFSARLLSPVLKEYHCCAWVWLNCHYSLLLSMLAYLRQAKAVGKRYCLAPAFCWLARLCKSFSWLASASRQTEAVGRMFCLASAFCLLAGPCKSLSWLASASPHSPTSIKQTPISPNRCLALAGSACFCRSCLVMQAAVPCGHVMSRPGHPCTVAADPQIPTTNTISWMKAIYSEADSAATQASSGCQGWSSAATKPTPLLLVRAQHTTFL